MNLVALQSHFEKIKSEFKGGIEFEAPLSKVAYYRIGGKAEVLVTPRTFQDLEKIHQILKETGARFFILGWGSNLLFPDSGLRGVVIRMKHLFSEIELESENVLKVGASVGASSLLREASLQGYGGLAHLTGIPGSVGGMVVMNAGTHLGEMKNCVLKTSFTRFDLTSDLKLEERIHEEQDFSYRHQHFLPPQALVTHAWLKITKATSESVKAEIDTLYQRRKATQPVDLPSCGSVFMNPKEQGMHAWQVIDRLGLRGHQIGQAQISEKHSNFIVNLGNASSEDVLSLIRLVEEKAKSELGIEMKREVKVIS